MSVYWNHFSITHHTKTFSHITSAITFTLINIHQPNFENHLNFLVESIEVNGAPEILLYSLLHHIHLQNKLNNCNEISLCTHSNHTSSASLIHESRNSYNGFFILRGEPRRRTFTVTCGYFLLRASLNSDLINSPLTNIYVK